MAILNKTGITNGGTIQAEHVTRTIDALTGVSTDTIVATGSFTGSFKGAMTGTATSASYAVTASYVASVESASYAPYTIYTQLQFGSLAANSMSDSTTYYFGFQGRAIDDITVANPVTNLLPNGRIEYVQFSYDNQTGTLGTGENVELYIYNMTTDVSESIGQLKFTTKYASTQAVLLNTAVEVSLDDTLVIKLVTPAWATNPTAVTMQASCLISATY